MCINKERETEKQANIKALIFFMGFNFLNMLDAILTHYSIIKFNVYEFNPLMRLLINNFGLIAFFIFKLFPAFILSYIAFRVYIYYRKEYMYYSLLIVCLTYLIVVLLNIYTLYSIVHINI
jgi:hypothetical protein